MSLYFLFNSLPTHIHSLFTRVHRSVEVVRDPDTPLSWPPKERTLQPQTGEAGEIQLQPVGPVRVPIEQQSEDESKLITLPARDVTPPGSDVTKPHPMVCQLECGNTICEFEFTLFEFSWEPEITHAPPCPPSSSNESGSSASEGEIAEEMEKGKDESSHVKEDAGEKRPPKVLNTEANVTKEQ